MTYSMLQVVTRSCAGFQSSLVTFLTLLIAAFPAASISSDSSDSTASSAAGENAAESVKITAMAGNSLGDLFLAVEPGSSAATQPVNRQPSQIAVVPGLLLTDYRKHLDLEQATPASLHLLHADLKPEPSMVYTANGHASALRFMPLSDAVAAGVNTAKENVVANGLAENERKDYGALYVADNDGQASMTKLQRLALEKSDIQWKIDEHYSQELDLAAIDGLFNVVELINSPWETLLAVEAFPVAATRYWNAPISEAKTDNQMAVMATAAANNVNQYMERESNPYRYGYVVEIVDQPLRGGGDGGDSDSSNSDTRPLVQRHYVTGRLPAGKSLMASDSKTLYRIASDNGVLFRFVSDFPNNLAAGTLSFARMIPIQSNLDNPYRFQAFNIEWVELGRGNDEEIAGWIADYEGMTSFDYTSGQTSYLNDKDIAAWFNKHKQRHLNANSDISQYIDSRVAFLEPIKAVEAVGADRQVVEVTDIAFVDDRLVLQLTADTMGECGELFAGAADVEGNLHFINRLPVLEGGTDICKSRFVLHQNERFLPSRGTLFLSDGESLQRVPLALHQE